MRGRGWLLGGVVLVLAGLGLAAWRGKWPAVGPVPPAQAAASAVPTLEFSPHEVVQPTLTRLARRVAFSGPLVAPDTAVVRAKAAGVLQELSFQEGSAVRAGQVLARVDPAELSSRVAEREAALAAARAAQAQAEKTQASNERLASQGFISPVALDNGRAALDSARAQTDQARAALQTARVGLRETSVLAPIAGVVAKRHVLPGEKVAAEQPVATLVNLARLELQGSVGTHEVAALAPGQPVQVQVEGVDKPLAGTLARIAPAAEAGTRSIGVVVALANPGLTLRAGQYALARVDLADDTPRLTLPLAALAGATGPAGDPQVWVLAGGQLARRAVSVGRRDESAGRVEVLSGVGAADQVLAARFENLREGAKAVLLATPQATASASAPALR
ncbi:RND family efflux transporter, MFP subunit [Burkholderiales bacterium JOSHI_001]|nr:RND family efflux transporter, MFP subunit [Burkholderiales bacterium JOSHI_001]